MTQADELERSDRPARLLPAENIAWTVAITQAFDGRDTGPNVTAALLLTIKRLAAELDTTVA